MSKVKRSKSRLFWMLLMGTSLLSACTDIQVSGWASQSQTLIPAGNACTNQNGGKVGIDVPGPGKVMVTAQAMLGLKSHTEG